MRDLCHDNRQFYESAPADWLEEIAFQKGIGGGEDLEALREELTPLLKKPTTLLEIGAGYGRAIDWLLRAFPATHIVGIEQSLPSVQRLREKYRETPQVEIEAGSILTYQPSRAIHVATWLWAGFAELGPSEKMAALKNIAGWLAPKGVLFVDMPLMLEAGFVHWATGFGTLNGHVLEPERIAEMAFDAGFESCRLLEHEESLTFLFFSRS